VGIANLSPSEDGLEVHEDEVVRNRSGLAAIRLDDGTRVDLRADTVVSLRRELDGGVSVILSPNREPSSGEVFCEVAKQKHPFRVVTSALSATVLGTKFLVRATGRASSVGVIEGRVRVASAGQEKIISRDQEAVVDVDQPILLARPLVDARAQLGWNKRVLESMPAPAPEPVRQTRPNPSVQPAPPVNQGPDDNDQPIAPPRK
jgi:ferric-dicitrate binding protein FerR (iron transport regulator)